MNTVFSLFYLSEEAIKPRTSFGMAKVLRSAILREAVEQYLERQQFPARKAKGGRQKGRGSWRQERRKQHKE
ncbi:hypothetical protein ACNKHM_11350 [Shigella sonnei]